MSRTMCYSQSALQPESLTACDFSMMAQKKKKNRAFTMYVYIPLAVIIALDLIIKNTRRFQTSPRSMLRYWDDKVDREAEIKKDC